MSFFNKVTEFLTGGFGSKIVDKVLKQFPDRLSDAEKAQIQAAIIDASREHEMKLLQFAKEQEEEFNQRIIEMEGTAKDLAQFGWLGRIIIFLRGAQRPIWGYSVLWIDFMVFSGKWELHEMSKTIGNNVVGSNIESAFWVINLLVLGFLFGERAMKNVLPLFKGLNTK
ncbi:hypothetical protein [Agaribacter marinus]|uniref:Holin of 3TMs, for gene-transfer release n=1 Tax=Agaribacter marinus TaxID=1431249 RepID=A0AA37T2B4_9ALTE|nr:hypothetical protein [Agaribacter marinus]GLR72675.1 hypothetical protein GCM10007852_35830 [Agaribacter marinus]